MRPSMLTTVLLTCLLHARVNAQGHRRTQGKIPWSRWFPHAFRNTGRNTSQLRPQDIGSLLTAWQEVSGKQLVPTLNNSHSVPAWLSQRITNPDVLLRSAGDRASQGAPRPDLSRSVVPVGSQRGRLPQDQLRRPTGPRTRFMPRIPPVGIKGNFNPMQPRYVVDLDLPDADAMQPGNNGSSSPMNPGGFLVDPDLPDPDAMSFPSHAQAGRRNFPDAINRGRQQVNMGTGGQNNSPGIMRPDGFSVNINAGSLWYGHPQSGSPQPRLHSRVQVLPGHTNNRRQPTASNRNGRIVNINNGKITSVRLAEVQPMGNAKARNEINSIQGPSIQRPKRPLPAGGPPEKLRTFNGLKITPSVTRTHGFANGKITDVNYYRGKQRTTHNSLGQIPATHFNARMTGSTNPGVSGSLRRTQSTSSQKSSVHSPADNANINGSASTGNQSPNPQGYMVISKQTERGVVPNKYPSAASHAPAIGTSAKSMQTSETANISSPKFAKKTPLAEQIGPVPSVNSGKINTVSLQPGAPKEIAAGRDNHASATNQKTGAQELAVKQSTEITQPGRHQSKDISKTETLTDAQNQFDSLHRGIHVSQNSSTNTQSSSSIAGILSKLNRSLSVFFNDFMLKVSSLTGKTENKATNSSNDQKSNQFKISESQLTVNNRAGNPQKTVLSSKSPQDRGIQRNNIKGVQINQRYMQDLKTTKTVQEQQQAVNLATPKHTGTVLNPQKEGSNPGQRHVIAQKLQGSKTEIKRQDKVTDPIQKVIDISGAHSTHAIGHGSYAQELSKAITRVRPGTKLSAPQQNASPARTAISDTGLNVDYSINAIRMASASKKGNTLPRLKTSHIHDGRGPSHTHAAQSSRNVIQLPEAQKSFTGINKPMSKITSPVIEGSPSNDSSKINKQVPEKSASPGDVAGGQVYQIHKSIGGSNRSSNLSKIQEPSAINSRSQEPNQQYTGNMESAKKTIGGINHRGSAKNVVGLNKSDQGSGTQKGPTDLFSADINGNVGQTTQHKHGSQQTVEGTAHSQSRLGFKWVFGELGANSPTLGDVSVKTGDGPVQNIPVQNRTSLQQPSAYLEPKSVNIEKNQQQKQVHNIQGHDSQKRTQHATSVGNVQEGKVQKPSHQAQGSNNYNKPPAYSGTAVQETGNSKRDNSTKGEILANRSTGTEIRHQQHQEHLVKPTQIEQRPKSTQQEHTGQKPSFKALPESESGYHGLNDRTSVVGRQQQPTRTLPTASDISKQRGSGQSLANNVPPMQSEQGGYPSKTQPTEQSSSISHAYPNVNREKVVQGTQQQEQTNRSHNKQTVVTSTNISQHHGESQYYYPRERLQVNRQGSGTSDPELPGRGKQESTHRYASSHGAQVEMQHIQVPAGISQQHPKQQHLVKPVGVEQRPTGLQQVHTGQKPPLVGHPESELGSHRFKDGTSGVDSKQPQITTVSTPTNMSKDVKGSGQSLTNNAQSMQSETAGYVNKQPPIEQSSGISQRYRNVNRGIVTKSLQPQGQKSQNEPRVVTSPDVTLQRGESQHLYPGRLQVITQGSGTQNAEIPTPAENKSTNPNASFNGEHAETQQIHGKLTLGGISQQQHLMNSTRLEQSPKSIQQEHRENMSSLADLPESATGGQQRPIAPLSTTSDISKQGTGFGQSSAKNVQPMQNGTNQQEHRGQKPPFVDIPESSSGSHRSNDGTSGVGSIHQPIATLSNPSDVSQQPKGSGQSLVNNVQPMQSGQGGYSRKHQPIDQSRNTSNTYENVNRGNATQGVWQQEQNIRSYIEPNIVISPDLTDQRGESQHLRPIHSQNGGYQQGEGGQKSPFVDLSKSPSGSHRSNDGNSGAGNIHQPTLSKPSDISKQRNGVDQSLGNPVLPKHGVQKGYSNRHHPIQQSSGISHAYRNVNSGTVTQLVQQQEQNSSSQNKPRVVASPDVNSQRAESKHHYPGQRIQVPRQGSGTQNHYGGSQVPQIQGQHTEVKAIGNSQQQNQQKRLLKITEVQQNPKSVQQKQTGQQSPSVELIESAPGSRKSSQGTSGVGSLQKPITTVRKPPDSSKLEIGSAQSSGNVVKPVQSGQGEFPDRSQPIVESSSISQAHKKINRGNVTQSVHQHEQNSRSQKESRVVSALDVNIQRGDSQHPYPGQRIQVGRQGSGTKTPEPATRAEQESTNNKTSLHGSQIGTQQLPEKATAGDISQLQQQQRQPVNPAWVGERPKGFTKGHSGQKSPLVNLSESAQGSNSSNGGTSGIGSGQQPVSTLSNPSDISKQRKGSGQSLVNNVTPTQRKQGEYPNKHQPTEQSTGISQAYRKDYQGKAMQSVRQQEQNSRNYNEHNIASSPKITPRHGESQHSNPGQRFKVTTQGNGTRNTELPTQVHNASSYWPQVESQQIHTEVTTGVISQQQKPGKGSHIQGPVGIAQGDINLNVAGAVQGEHRLESIPNNTISNQSSVDFKWIFRDFGANSSTISDVSVNAGNGSVQQITSQNRTSFQPYDVRNVRLTGNQSINSSYQTSAAKIALMNGTQQGPSQNKTAQHNALDTELEVNDGIVGIERDLRQQPRGPGRQRRPVAGTDQEFFEPVGPAARRRPGWQEQEVYEPRVPAPRRRPAPGPDPEAQEPRQVAPWLDREVQEPRRPAPPPEQEGWEQWQPVQRRKPSPKSNPVPKPKPVPQPKPSTQIKHTPQSNPAPKPSTGVQPKHTFNPQPKPNPVSQPNPVPKSKPAPQLKPTQQLQPDAAIQSKPAPDPATNSRPLPSLKPVPPPKPAPQQKPIANPKFAVGPPVTPAAPAAPVAPAEPAVPRSPAVPVPPAPAPKKQRPKPAATTAALVEAEEVATESPPSSPRSRPSAGGVAAPVEAEEVATESPPSPPASPRSRPSVGGAADVVGANPNPRQPKRPYHPCNDCVVVGGIGYNKHRDDCQLFYQCLFQGRMVKPVVRSCPLGQFWDQASVACRYARDVNCDADPCADPRVEHYQHGNDCVLFWQCQHRKTEGVVCCLPGEGYAPGFGCVTSYSCHESCPGQPVPPKPEPRCNKVAYNGDPTRYVEYVRGYRPYVGSCARGSAFNSETCRCSYKMTPRPYHPPRPRPPPRTPAEPARPTPQSSLAPPPRPAPHHRPAPPPRLAPPQPPVHSQPPSPPLPVAVEREVQGQEPIPSEPISESNGEPNQNEAGAQETAEQGAEQPPSRRVCRPSVYLPFDDDTEDYSGNHLAVQNEGVIIDRRPGIGAVGRGAAYFNGAARLLIWRFANAHFRSGFQIKFRYREIRGYPTTNHLQGLVTNSDCLNAGSVAVAYNTRTRGTYAHILSTESGTHSVEDNYEPGWKLVHFTSDGTDVQLTVNGEGVSTDLLSPIASVHPALHIGYGCSSTFDYFTGYLDELYVFMCAP